jgi:branched-subunit amino acid transport protein
VSFDATVVGAVLLLAVGTLALRLTGPLLRARVEPSPQLQALIDRSVAVLFCALIATSTLLQDDRYAGVARTAGVSVAGLLAWRRAPFVLVVLAAASTTAILRLLGSP